MNTCECVRDSDAQCNACKEKMQVFVRNFSDIIQRMVLEMQEIPKSMKGMCQPCGKQYLDVATAGIISSTPHISAEGLIAALKQMRMLAQPLGITAMPLTDKAAMEVFKAKGWSIPN
jgi:hypothetical protein